MQPTSDTTARLLAEVATRGPEALAATATQLLRDLARRPEDEALLGTARLVIDAYLNDPYLTR